MFARLGVLALAVCLFAAPTSAQLLRGSARNNGPAIGDLQRILLSRGTETPVDIVEHRCEPRPSALFGPNTFRCSVTLTGGSQLIVVITFDSGWVVVSR